MKAACALAVLCVLPLVAAGGCGGKNKEDEQAAQRTVNRFAAALRDENAAGACRLLSRAGRRELSSSSEAGGARTCEERIEFELAFGEGLGRLADARTTGADVDGDEALVKVSLGNQERDVALLKEGGRWKLGGLGL